ncbi:MAG: MotA/TolQ/ExbB proton channel family protein [Caulobacterales bacterium]|nr:MotA/TolQ/ExbB proton channel family protein [Caulobacterales bacterium]
MIRTISSLAVAAWAGAALFTAPAAAQNQPASSLRELLSRIQQDSQEQSAEARRREAEFQRGVNEQAALLAQAQAELDALIAEGEALTAQFDANDEIILDLEDELRDKQGEFGELFGVARQAAGDVRALLDASNVSAQFPDRTAALARVAASSRLPTRTDLDEIWKRQIEEMIAQRDVVTFPARVANFSRDGRAVDAEVTRIGVFTVFANAGGSARFVDFQDGEITVLSRQPSGRLVSAATTVMRSNPDRLVAGPVDPSRGELLSLIIDAPTLGERINQGGVVGYVIITMAIIGIAFGILRVVMLSMLNARVSGQARRADRPSQGNPLGRVLLAAQQARDADVETFELKLDDAIIKESAGLDFGLNFLKLAAAIAPLLGLLGTVTGMIITFQQITLFGTGDPKIMAGGISQALMTTVLGLVAAIPLLLIHSFAASASRGVQQIMEEQAAGIVAEHAERVHRGGSV